MLSHRARTADVEVPQETAVLSNLKVKAAKIFNENLKLILSDHSQGVIGAVAAQGKRGKRGETTQRDESTLANLQE